MTKKILATFRIDEKDWEAFKQWTESNNSNASRELIKHILTCIGKINSEDSSTYIDSNLDKHIDNYLIKNLDNRIDDSVDEYLGNNLDKYLDENIDKHLDKYLNSRLDEAVSEAVSEATADLKKEFQPKFDSSQQTQQLAEDDELRNAVAKERIAKSEIAKDVKK